MLENTKENVVKVLKVVSDIEFDLAHHTDSRKWAVADRCRAMGMAFSIATTILSNQEEFDEFIDTWEFELREAGVIE